MTAVTESQRTTPRELLEQAGKLDKAVLAVLVDGEVVDLMTPVAPDSDVTPLTVEDPRALAVLRHSAAHVMADAVQRLFPGTQVTILVGSLRYSHTLSMGCSTWKLFSIVVFIILFL